jgi:hypothetical protein
MESALLHESVSSSSLIGRLFIASCRPELIAGLPPPLPKVLPVEVVA